MLSKESGKPRKQKKRRKQQQKNSSQDGSQETQPTQHTKRRIRKPRQGQGKRKPESMIYPLGACPGGPRVGKHLNERNASMPSKHHLGKGRYSGLPVPASFFLRRRIVHRCINVFCVAFLRLISMSQVASQWVVTGC
eukprot:gnl/TRDRNA2_/TRDRNA2_169429_c0_seq1.p1 gnl/TRDRNA2_/TRDRNA2_169429_c0~~gnl/TRDRNA2_/TRDRNA2_169429_c0_seq1.p1  ORF type:complete len:137 (-),score=5.35 gnl/TRDRNA2_/TRDRNA2_169429_c0_seq1:245-655(-)